MPNPITRTRRVAANVLAGVIALSACAACLNAQTSTAAPVAASQTLKASDRGLAVKVTVEIDRTELTVADRVVLIVSVDAPCGCTVDLPNTSQLAGFTTVWSRVEKVAATDAGREVTQQTTTLEPFLAGNKSIPELSITTRAGEASAAAGQSVPRGTLASVTVKSQPMPVHVTAIAPKEADAATPLNAGSVPLPTIAAGGIRPMMVVIIGAACVTMGLAGGVYIALRRTRREPTPLEVAYREMDELALRFGAVDQHAASSFHPALAAELGRVLRRFCADGLAICPRGASTGEVVPRLLVAGQISEVRRSEGAALLKRLDAAAYAPPVDALALDRSASELLAQARSWLTACGATLDSTSQQGRGGR